MGEPRPRGRSRKSRAGTASLATSTGLDRLVAAANPRAGVGRPTSRVFGDRGSRALARHAGGAASAGAVVGSEKAEAGAPTARRRGMVLERINEDTAVDHPAS
ncbi:hypothetical protein EJB05_52995, partial [Eragrostis curvula]